MEKRIKPLAVVAMAGVAVIALTGCVGTQAAVQPTVAAVSDTVSTTNGDIRGAVDDGYRYFQGVPYAAPPTGGRRWKAPEPAEAWTGVRDGTTVASRCIQAPFTLPGLDSGAPESEDCLTLNISTPLNADESSDYSVLFWIPGGGYLVGSGDTYGGKNFATEGNIVVVTMNYRLGPLGWLSDPALDPDGGNVGNYGLQDQLAALSWVQDNIQRFGGDPKKVTVAGESMGSQSVCNVLASPEASGQFRSAMILSGPCISYGGTTAEKSVEFSTSVGCDSTSADYRSCMEALPVDSLRVGISGPDLDAQPAPMTPEKLESAMSDVPVLIGFNSDEGRYFSNVRAESLSDEQEYRDQVTSNLRDGEYRGEVQEILDAYPASAYDGSILSAYAALQTEQQFICNTSYSSSQFSVNNPVYQYEFGDENAPAPVGMEQAIPLRAAHTLELPYLFNMVGYEPKSEDQQALSEFMISAWSQFINTGNPNQPESTDWPTLSDSSGARMHLTATEQTLVTDAVADRPGCSYWSEQNLGSR